MKQKLEKWSRWIRRIHEDVGALVWATAIYKQTYDVVAANDKINQPNAFLQWLSYCYSRTSLVGLRRQIDHHKESISMWKLLCEVRHDAHLVTREYHQSLYSSIDVAQASWNNTVGAEHDSYPVSRVADQIDGLSSVRDTVKTFVDKNVVHLDKKETMASGGTFGETFHATDQLALLAKHWRLVLTAESINPEIPLSPNWKLIFHHPWIDPLGQD